MIFRLVGVALLSVLGVTAGEREHPTLEGTVVCGYQGWFRAEGDASGQGWVHYGPGRRFAPGACSFDLWPDLTEYTAAERYPTIFKWADGKPAELFSSVHPLTVARHYRWMREYGIDGAMQQRFAVDLGQGRGGAAVDTVLRLSTASANAEGRSLTVMYDLSGLKPEKFSTVSADWEKLIAAGQTKQPCAQFHGGKPLVALWGLGFSDRAPAIAEWRALLTEIKATGAAIMLGVPSYWREGKADALPDPEIQALIKMADIVSPWSVGRYGRPSEVVGYAKRVWQADFPACTANGQGYLPVIFPGFSWHNLSALRGKAAPLDQIPRQGGQLLWKQALEAKQTGAKMLYVAMFDEIDEGTAIMKCGGPRPVGPSPFIDLGDVPTDHYLWLTGQIGKMIRGQIPPTAEWPKR